MEHLRDTRAALLLQRNFRGYSTRLLLLRWDIHALMIQLQVRVRAARKEVQGQREARATTRLTACWRRCVLCGVLCLGCMCPGERDGGGGEGSFRVRTGVVVETDSRPGRVLLLLLLEQLYSKFPLFVRPCHAQLWWCLCL